jgi:hypothetical protein
MKHIVYTFIIAGMLTSCNSPGPSDVAADTPSTKTEVAAPDEMKADVKLEAITTEEALVATALMAAPEESRAGAKVMGYNMAGEFVTYREGTNEFICLTDDPSKKGFNAACYHQDLDPFMARGRALRSEGKSAKEIFDIREIEAKAGTLDMGEAGKTLHIYYGKETAYNPETGMVEGAKYRYVVYMPFATAASTGLPESPIAPNHPWIMNPGTHRAHIMISPLE